MNNEIKNPISQKALLEKYVAAVMAAPSSLALTATRDPAEFWERHVLDALKLIESLPASNQKEPLQVIDIGSGNGIPGIPIAIALPGWSIVLLDSNNKKCGFLDMFCKFNAIKNVRVVAAPAEEFGRDPVARDKFDLGLARAVGKLPVALELALPFIKPGGRLLVPHGASYKSEINEIGPALKELRSTFVGTTPYQLNKAVTFTILTFKKDHETPEKYPRRIGQARKRPL